jgi:hypothetical protein
MLIHFRMPRRAGSAVFLALVGLLWVAPQAPAQQQDSGLPSPRLLTIFPPGGKAGTTIEMTFTGTDLEEPQKLIFSHPEIKAEPIIPAVPPPDPKKKPPVPAPKPAVTGFKVTIPAGVPLGLHDVRLVNKWGISNVRTFIVGDLKEFIEKEPNNDLPQTQKIELNSTVSGNIANQTDVDYYSFSGKKGQRVVFHCAAGSIDSRLHAGLEIYDASNRLLTQNRNYKDTDALCDLVLPADGDYSIRLFHFTHTAGNAEYFYRLTVSTAPWIDAVFPPVVEPGKPTQVTVYGRNLPGGQPDPRAVVDDSILDRATITVNPPSGEALTRITFSGRVTPSMSGLDGFDLRVRNGTGSSNPFFLGFARAPVVLENKDNDTAETAQTVTVPCEIAGRIEKRRDRDWYVFTGKKGDVFSIDLASDRLGSPGDVYFVLRNPASKQAIVEQDDEPFSLNNQSGALGPKLFSRTDDPGTYRFVVPADGPYQLMVASRTGSILAGPRHVYRLRIAPEQPDFRLLVLGPDKYRPSAPCAQQGGNAALRVLAWRQEGFNGDITITAEGLPKGVTCKPQTLGNGLRHMVLVVSAAADAPEWTGQIKVKGTATINGKPVVREARPAGISLVNPAQQNISRAGRLERDLVLAVRDRAPWALTTTIDKPEILQGDKAVITVKLNRLWPEIKQAIQLQANAQSEGNPPWLPQNLNIQQVNINAGQAEAKLNVTVNQNTPPGVYNIVLRSQMQFNGYSKEPKNPKVRKQNILVVQPSTPITLTIIPKLLARVTVATPQPNIKVGGQTEVVVRVNRQFNYDGEFKVKLELPGNSSLSAPEVTIPAGQTEVKVVVKATANAAPGGRGNLIARATALFNGKTPIVQETRFNLNVVK